MALKTKDMCKKNKVQKNVYKKNVYNKYANLDICRN